MESKIFHLESQETVETLNEYSICKEDFEFGGIHNWFVGEVASFVTDPEKDLDNIIYFIDSLESIKDYIKVEHCGEEVRITFLKGFKYAYFKDRFNKVKDFLYDMDMETFCTNMDIASLEELIENKKGFYIFSSVIGLINIDKFIRYFDNDEEYVYYFGNTLDYYCI